MPTGSLYSANVDECNAAIDAIHCNECLKMCKLCPEHRNHPSSSSLTNGSNDSMTIMRPFVIIIVRDVQFDHSTIRSKGFEMYPFCGRKLSNEKGLVYTLETTEEVNTRFGKNNTMMGVQSYTNVDLYWMRWMGWKFEVIGGFGWKTTATYQKFISQGFEIRKKAKERGDVVMSEFIKLQINGSYGVTAQCDISDAGFLAKLPSELSGLNPLDGRVSHWLHTKRSSQLHHSEYVKDGTPIPNGQTYFTKAKAPGIAEYFSAVAPVQIGAAVLAWSRHIVNLIIMQHHVRPMKYTDTDSICVPQRVVRQLEQNCPGVIDHSKTAPLGTLKNDHVDSCGPDSRVFFSVYGTKKVKMYFILSSNGKVSISNTFKGLNPNMLDESGKRFHNDRYEHTVSKTIMELFYEGRADPVEVTSWKRTLNGGVEITTHPQHFNSATYLDRSKGSVFEFHRDNGMTEMFVPYGSNVQPRFEFYNAIAHLNNNNNRHKDMRIARNAQRKEGLKAAMGGRDKQDMMLFLEQYYSHRNEYQLSENAEYQHACEVIARS